MTKQFVYPKTYYVVCFVGPSQFLSLLSFDVFMSWMTTYDSLLLTRPTITTISLN